MKIVHGVGWAVVFAVLVALVMKALERPNDVAITAARDTVRITDTLRLAADQAETRQNARADTAKRASDAAKQKSDASDKPVTITSPTSITVTRPETTIVVETPEEVTRDLTDLRATVTKQAATILADSAGRDSARVARHADSVAFAARDKLIALQKPPSHWGYGFAAGPTCSNQGCGLGVTFGVTWRP